MKTVSRLQLGQKKPYQTTAISPTCDSVALITRTDFQIFSIPKPGIDGTITLKSCGVNDARFGRSANTMAWCYEELSNPRVIKPDYIGAAMSDRLLCIACVQNCVDIHDTFTGRRIDTMEFRSQSWTIVMSPNGKLLAVGMENGGLLLYNIERVGHCTMTPALIETSFSQKSITSIAFSPNSAFVSFCTSDNKISTYGVKDGVPILLSNYNRNLDVKSCRDPYYGVTSLA